MSLSKSFINWRSCLRSDPTPWLLENASAPPGCIRCNVRVALRRDDDGTEYNRVRRFDVLGIDEPVRDPFAPTDEVEGGADPIKPPKAESTDGIADGPGGAPDFETFTLPASFSDVVSVSIFTTMPPNGFAVDNLVTEAPVVPTMGTWGLAALATALAGGGCRLFRARTAGAA